MKLLNLIECDKYWNFSFLLLFWLMRGASDRKWRLENSFQFIIVETSSVESHCQYCPGAQWPIILISLLTTWEAWSSEAGARTSDVLSRHSLLSNSITRDSLNCDHWENLSDLMGWACGKNGSVRSSLVPRKSLRRSWRAEKLSRRRDDSDTSDRVCVNRPGTRADL